MTAIRHAERSGLALPSQIRSMMKRKTPTRRRKARGAVVVAGTLALIGAAIEVASGGVTVAERVLALVVKARQALAPSANAAGPAACELPRK
ncbi:hypothetical protein F0U59_25250 [Archangium gephyra]|nr:hypothetical protein F0U59_25250 [Archangium gephyra]